METIGDWVEFAAIALFLGLYGWARTMSAKPYPIKLRRSLAGWLLWGVAFATWGTFRWRAFEGPLVFIAIPAVVGGLILWFAARPRGGQQPTAEPSANNHK